MEFATVVNSLNPVQPFYKSMDCSQASLSHFPGKNTGDSLRDLPNPRIECASPALAGEFYHKENEIMPFATWIDLEIVTLSEASQTKASII